ncbi:MAG TPA: hypothetical protein VGB85_18385, partial [Nannocystis sp.]
YNVVVSAVSMGPGLNYALRVTGHRTDDVDLALSYLFDTPGLEMGQAVAVGPLGYIWFGGVRSIGGVLHAVAGRGHG